MAKSLSPSLFCYEEFLFCRRTELQSRFFARAQFDSLCSKSRLYLLKFSLIELLLKGHNQCFPLIKPTFCVLNGWHW